MENDVKYIQVKDNRLFRPMIFIEKNGMNGNRQMTLQQSTTVTVDKCEIAFASPNPISLFMNIAKKEHNLARVIYKKLIKPNLKPDSTFKVPDLDLPELLDYFEHIQTSVITIYSAIEALANVAIPGDYTIEKINNRGVKETWTKESMERWISTSEKIADIVPIILKIETPKNQLFWNGFKKLEAVRNDIIHQKYSQKKPNDVDSGFLGILLSEEIYDNIQSCYHLIVYFCEKDDSHTFFPLLPNNTSIKPIEVDDWDTFFTWVPFRGSNNT